MRWLLAWLANAAALLLLAYLLPSVQVASFSTALLVAAVLGLINLLLRPILVLLTLPVTLLTFGLFLLVINGAMFLLVDKLVDGFHVGGLWPAIYGSLIYSLISWVLQSLLGVRKG
jgi:putative membrane protein